MNNERLTIVDIAYNHLLPSIEIEINGKEVSNSSKTSKYKKEQLQSCVSDLIDLLIEEINDDEFELNFVGRMMDFNDLKAVCSQYPHIKLVHQQSESTVNQPVPFQNKIDQLTDLVDFMQSGPIKELRSKQIRENYERAINSEFEIAVVATMSSGKSTLINAILGSDLIPSKNMACTAKISKIRNVNNQPIFSVSAYDNENNLVETHEVATEEILTRFNEDSNIHLTCVEGKLPNIKCDAMNLILIDTPGPNNSQDASHREKMMEVIKNDEYKPLVLYILNATQLGINDDQSLLNLICEEMQDGDKQAKDRFIFVLNKIDEFDPEKESVEDAIMAARQYLENNGIKNPNLYPASAHIAKNIRKYLNGMELTRREKKSLSEDVDYLIETEALHLLDYTPLSDYQKEKLKQDLKKFKEMDSEEGDYLQALYHTGIPYIEEAINEYLNKYAVTFKIQEAIGSFQRIINKKNLEQKILSDLENSTKKVEKNIQKIQNNKTSIEDEKQRIQSNVQQISKAQEKISLSSSELQTKGQELQGTLIDLERVDENAQNINQTIQSMEKELLNKEKEAQAVKDILSKYDSTKFKDRVNALNIDTYSETRPVRGKLNESILRVSRQFKEKGKVPRREAELIISQLQSQLEFIMSDIKTDLDRVIDSKIKKTVINLMDEYKKEISGLFIDNDSIDLNSASIKFIMSSVPTGKELVQQYSYNEEVAIGTEQVKNYDKKWFKPWTWGESSYYERTIYETREFVDISALLNDYIKDVNAHLEENLSRAVLNIEQQVRNIKVDFNKKVSNFEEILRIESEKYEKLIEDFKISQQRKLEEEEKLSVYHTEQQKLIEEKQKLIELTEKLRSDSKGLQQDQQRLEEENRKLALEIENREKNLIRLDKEYSQILKRKEAIQLKKEFLDQINDKLNLIIGEEYVKEC